MLRDKGMDSEMLTDLAENLADDFDNARWGDIQDDISLCVWVEHKTQVLLTLEEATNLRQLLNDTLASRFRDKEEAEIGKFR